MEQKTGSMWASIVAISRIGGTHIAQLSWEIRVPIFRNRLILKQLGLAIGIPFGGLLIALILLKASHGLLLVGITFALAVPFILVVFRGTYDVRYELNSRGVLCQSQKKQSSRVLRTAMLTVFLSLLQGSFTVAGAGLLSGAGVNKQLRWKQIKRLRYAEKQRTITLSAGFGEEIVLFCTEDNYTEVCQYLNDRKGQWLPCVK